MNVLCSGGSQSQWTSSASLGPGKVSSLVHAIACLLRFSSTLMAVAPLSTGFSLVTVTQLGFHSSSAMTLQVSRLFLLYLSTFTFWLFLHTTN